MGFQDALYELGVPYASRRRRSSSPTARWRRSATTPTGLDRARRRSAAATRATAARCGTAASCRIDIARPAGRASAAATIEVDRAARRSTGTRCAQRIGEHGMRNSQLRGDRADGDDLQHRRRAAPRSSRRSATSRQVEPLGRVHGRQRVPGARPEEARAVGRGDGRWT